jgi:glycogen(starch) synthase
MKRVAIYSHFFAPSIGGVETHSATLANLLSERGFSVVVITGTTSSGMEPKRRFNVVRVPTLPRLYQLIKQSDILVMQGLNLPSYVLGKITGKKVIWYHHGYDLNFPGGGFPTYQGFFRTLKQFHVKSFKKFLLYASFQSGRIITTVDRRIDHIVTSRFMLERMNNCLHSARVIVLYYPLESRYLSANSKVAKVYDFLMYGRLTAGKGEDLYIKALGILKRKGINFSAAIFGPSPVDKYPISLIAKEGVADFVSYLGPIEHEKTIDIIDKSRIGVFPSTWAEAFGIVAIECMARGAFVIASKIGGLAEVVSGRGLLVKPKDLTELADKMSWAFENKQAVEQIATDAREWVKTELDPNVYARKFIDKFVR